MVCRLIFIILTFSALGFLRSIQSSEANIGPLGCPERSLIGSNNLNIPDSSITASSYYQYEEFKNDARYKPHMARLHGNYGWAPRVTDNPNDYLQIDLGTERVIAAVATQGNGGERKKDYEKGEWVTKYKLNFTNDITMWKSYKNENRQQKVFNGNRDMNSVVRHNLRVVIVARYIRFIPVDYSRYKTIRVNVYIAAQEAPRFTSIITDARSIQLQWTVRPCSSRDRITGYLVRNGIDTFEVTGDNRAYTLTNLKPYTECYLAIKVIKYLGYGVWSNTLKTRTNEDVPEAIPSITSVEANSSHAILIRWKLQHYELVHGPLKGYQIIYTPQGGNTKTLDVGVVTVYNLTSLLKYTNYSITVAVKNTKYIGPQSKEQTVRTLEDVPEAVPSIVYVEATSSQSIAIKWKLQKAELVHGPLEGYQITYTPQGGNTTTIDVGVVTMYNLMSLLKYTNYSIAVAVKNTKYIGALSQEQTVRTLEDVPEAVPSIVYAKATSSQSIAIKWKLQKAELVHGPLEGYQITYTPQGGNTSIIDVGVIIMYNLTSLLKYTKYSIAVAVKNTKYIGPPSLEQTVRTFEDEPEAVPSNVYVEATSSQTIVVRWELRKAVLVHGPLEGYQITYKPQGGNTTTIDVGAVTMYNLTSLLKYTNYSIAVAVKNTKYIGALSQEQTVRTLEDVPEAVPSIVYVEATSSQSIAIKWKLQKAELVHGPLEGYQITYTPQGGNTTTIDVGVVSMYNLTSLLKYTNYSIAVAVKNTKYIGALSQEQTVRTLEDVPEAVPSIVYVEATSSQSIAIKWKLQKAELVHGPLEGYQITYTPQGGNTSIIDVGVIIMYNLMSLLKYTNYSIAVAVKNTKYIGALSQEQTVRTLEDVPEAVPSIVYVEATSSQSIAIKWKLQKAELVHGQLEGYQITYTPQGGNTTTIDVGVVSMYNLTSLLKYTNYSIAVAVKNTKYIGALSQEQTVQTKDSGSSEKSLVFKNSLKIPDRSFTASSFYKTTKYDLRYAPYKAKINGSYGWSPKEDSNPNDYLQIDLGAKQVITAVATQGNGGDKNRNPPIAFEEWVTKYQLLFANNLSKWRSYKDKNRKITIFSGNTDTDGIVRHDLDNPITARYIRFVPVEYHISKTMRVNIIYVAKNG